MSASSSICQIVQQRFPQWVIGTHAYGGDQTVVLKREGLRRIAEWLRDEASMRFEFLMDLSCVDYLRFGRTPGSSPTLTTPSPLPSFMKPKPPAEPWQRQVGREFRFEVVYHLYSVTHNHRLRLKVPVAAADAAVDSITAVWNAADWFEREVWDMFGVRFTGHPNLKRLLMYDGFEGHPLRKDYPVSKRQPLIGPVN